MFSTELGLPAGVANLVLGAGATAGGPLSTHEDVDMVSFTGGLVTGRLARGERRSDREEGRTRARRQESQRDLRRRRFRCCRRQRAERGIRALRAGLLGGGAAGRGGLHRRALRGPSWCVGPRRSRLGGPFDDDAETGPLISAQHREKVTMRTCRRAVAEGCPTAHRWPQAPERRPRRLASTHLPTDPRPGAARHVGRAR